MALSALKPQPGEGGKVALGCLSSIVLHVVATIVVMIIGGAIGGREGYLLVLPFWVGIGLTQWIYLGPAAWALRRWGSAGVAKGLVIAGAVGSLLAGLCWGGMLIQSLNQAAQVRQIQNYEREHPSKEVSTEGVVTVVDAAHFEFRQDDGKVVSLLLWQGLKYIFLKADGGYEERTREILKPGVRVLVDYSKHLDGQPSSASIVRVYQEGAVRR